MGANLFQQYLQPARSVMDYMGDMDDQDLRRAQLEGAQRQNALQALVAQQQQKEMAYTDQGRNAIRSAYSANAGAAPDALAGALEQTGHPLAIERADALRKSILDRSKTTAEVGEKTAKTAKETFDLMTSRLNFIGNTIGSVTDARKYAVWKQALTVGGFDVSQFPAEYDPEAVATIGQMTLTMKDRLEQAAKDRKFGLEAANEVMTPDGKGGYVPNAPLIGAKSQIANAGKTNVSLNVNTAKNLTAEMAQGLGKQLDAGLAAATSAQNTISNARDLRKLVEGGNVITGPGADQRVLLLRVGETLGVTGKDTAEKLANTATAVQNLAKAELQAAEAMKGQGQITEAERAIIKRAAAGSINMTGPELAALSTALEKTARGRIASHQANVQRLRTLPGAEALAPFYEAPQVPGETVGPAGAVLRFDAKGNPVK
jgi:hypothetical protein